MEVEKCWIKKLKKSPPPKKLNISAFLTKLVYKFNKACHNSDMENHKSFNGFTLAEVLITLGIIGIVAALTLPTLITNYQKKRAVTQLKATYSILSQAFEMAKSDYGDMTYWDTGSYYGQTSDSTKLYTSFAEKYFVPYIKPVKNYGVTSFKNIGYDGIYYLNKTKDNNALGGQRYIVSLANGSIIAISLDGHCDQSSTDSNGNWVCDTGWYYTSIYMIVDINGLQRPNTEGKDIFVMNVNSNKFGFYNYSNTANDRNWLLNACSENSTENRHCGRLIQYDGWEIKYKW